MENEKEIKWKDMKCFFEYLNQNIQYVVMRNFESLPEQFPGEKHGDIDLLVDDYDKACKMTGAAEVYGEKYRVHNIVCIGTERIRFDYRFVGDSYYDKRWEKRILEKRKMLNGIYVPDEENYKYMLLYHALVHKNEIASDYVNKLDILFGDGKWGTENLKSFLKAHNYKMPCPYDLSVIYNWKIMGAMFPLKRYIQKAISNIEQYIRNKFGK